MQPNTKAQLRQAHQLILEGHYGPALEILTPICKADPANADAWWLVANAFQDPEKVKLALKKVLDLKPNHVMAKALLKELTAPPIKTANRPSHAYNRPIRRDTTPRHKWGFWERTLNKMIGKIISLVVIFGAVALFVNFDNIVHLPFLDDDSAQLVLPTAINTIALNSQANSNTTLIPSPITAPVHTPTTAAELPSTWTPSPVPVSDVLPTVAPWWDTSPTPFPNSITDSAMQGETAQVIRVIDGDTIDARLQNETVRVRYLGMNTPESDEPCYNTASNANAALVQGQTVRLLRDISDTDQYGRLLRYVYVGNTFVNQVLIEQGMAEAVYYSPDGLFFSDFSFLEAEAANAGIGCHPTGIFDDGSDTR